MTSSANGRAGRATFPDGLRLGGGTLTRLPMTPPRLVDSEVGRVAMLTAPLWGLLVGSLAGGAVGVLWWWLGRDGSTPVAAAALCAVIAVAGLAWLSRGLHLDGLADTIDGFASLRRGADALAVMRDPNVGALGAAGLVLVLLLQISALTVVITASTPLAVVVVMAAVGLISRAVLPWAVRTGTPRSDSGLGHVVVGSVAPWPGGLVLAASALGTIGLLTLANVTLFGAALAVVVIVFAVELLRRAACGRFGVINGDVLGSLVETATMCALVLVAVSL